MWHLLPGNNIRPETIRNNNNNNNNNNNSNNNDNNDIIITDIMYVKPFYLCSRNVALTVFNEMCSASFFMEIKMYSQRNSLGTDKENIGPGNLCII